MLNIIFLLKCMNFEGYFQGHDIYRKKVAKEVFHFFQQKGQNQPNLVNFIVIGIFINKNTYIIPTEAYVTYRSVKDTDNVSRHFFY